MHRYPAHSSTLHSMPTAARARKRPAAAAPSAGAAVPKAKAAATAAPPSPQPFVPEDTPKPDQWEVRAYTALDTVRTPGVETSILPADSDEINEVMNWETGCKWKVRYFDPTKKEFTLEARMPRKTRADGKMFARVTYVLDAVLTGNMVHTFVDPLQTHAGGSSPSPSSPRRPVWAEARLGAPGTG